jgi:hypothetical protein
VAACAHKISINALRKFLSCELQKAQGIKIRGVEVIWCQNQVQILEAVITAHHANPLTFTESDSQVAQALVQIFATNLKSTTQDPEALVKLTIAKIPSHSFHYPYIRRMIQGYAARLSSEIKALKDTCSWFQAHRETRWFSTLLV